MFSSSKSKHQDQIQQQLQMQQQLQDQKQRAQSAEQHFISQCTKLRYVVVDGNGSAGLTHKINLLLSTGQFELYGHPYVDGQHGGYHYQAVINKHFVTQKV